MDPVPYQQQINLLDQPNFQISHSYDSDIQAHFEKAITKICRSENIRQALKVGSIISCLIGAAALCVFVIEVIDPSAFNMLYIAIPASLAFITLGALHRIYAHNRHEHLKTKYQKFFNAAVREIVSQINLDDPSPQSTRFRALIEKVAPYVSELTFQHDRIHQAVPHAQIPDLIKMFKKMTKVTFDRVPLTPEITRAIAHVGVAELEVIGAKAIPHPIPPGFNHADPDYLPETFTSLGLIHLNYEFIINLTKLRLTRIDLETTQNPGEDAPKNDILRLLEYKKIKNNIKELHFLDMQEPTTDEFYTTLHECYSLEILGVDNVPNPADQRNIITKLKGSRVSELYIQTLAPELVTALLDDFSKKVKEQTFATIKTLHFTNEFTIGHLQIIANHKNRFTTIEIPQDLPFVEPKLLQKFQENYEPDTGAIEGATLKKGTYKQKDKGFLSYVPNFK